MKTIDEAIRHCNEVADCANHDCAFEHKQLAEWLCELKERRESDLRPATKFLNASKVEQYIHIEEELAEARACMNANAFDRPDGTVDRIAEELVDLQMACETMLAMWGLDDQQRREVRRKVIAKNTARGYYETSK